jgi:hypothetical protein
VGYGEPTFAAFYPNCHSVFGFYDSEITELADGLQYDVIVWYSDETQDYFATSIHDFTTAQQLNHRPNLHNSAYTGSSPYKRRE